MGSHDDPLKWRMPGWRIEQRYANNVLIGNWAEERHKFQRGEQKHNSTHRVDFQHYGQFRPDVLVRRKAQLQNDGLGKEFLFYHHGDKYSNNMISWYDEQFNKRERDEKNALPDLRHWDSHSLSWQPEKSDHPIQGAPTNFGLYGALKSRWQGQIADETHGDFDTTYTADFLKHGNESMAKTRYAVPREQSTTLNKSNHTNQNLDLRGKPIMQQPEILPKLQNRSVQLITQ